MTLRQIIDEIRDHASKNWHIEWSAKQREWADALESALAQEGQAIATDDEVEAVAKQSGWDNRRYMTPPDYAEWCRRMRLFASLARPAAPVAQDGWKLVPVELTREMHAAAMNVLATEAPWGFRSVYRAMLAAAPTPDGEAKKS